MHERHGRRKVALVYPQPTASSKPRLPSCTLTASFTTHGKLVTPLVHDDPLSKSRLVRVCTAHDWLTGRD